jgi:hypothetical protein
MATCKSPSHNPKHKYVKIQRVGPAAVEVLSFHERMDGTEIKGWSAAEYSVTTLEAGPPPSLKLWESHIKWTGSAWMVGDLRAKGLANAVKIVIGTHTDADLVRPRRRTATSRPATTGTRRGTSRARAAAQAAPATGSAELPAALAQSITDEAIRRQAQQNARPSEGGGSEVARRPARQGSGRRETAKQRRAREARERAAAASAAADATTASIDAALSTTEGAAADASA